MGASQNSGQGRVVERHHSPVACRSAGNSPLLTVAKPNSIRSTTERQSTVRSPEWPTATRAKDEPMKQIRPSTRTLIRYRVATMQNRSHMRCTRKLGLPAWLVPLIILTSTACGPSVTPSGVHHPFGCSADLVHRERWRHWIRRVMDPRDGGTGDRGGRCDGRSS